MLDQQYHQNAVVIGQNLHNANKILLITHKNPDGDTMGSAMALYDYLYHQQKRVDLFCVDPFPEDFAFLPYFDRLIHHFNVEDYDLVICVDCAAQHMTGISKEMAMIFGGDFPLINIDHHPSNEGFGKWNIVDTQAASTTLIIMELLIYLEIEISHHMATCLLCGLYTDTGSFQHSNTDTRGMRAASYLLKRGAALYRISKNIFQTYKLETLKLWGRVLSRIYKDDNNVTISHVSDRDFTETKTSASDLSGVIDYLNSVPDAQFSLLLTENNGNVKGSFRTLQDDVDVAEIASNLGGGGHKKAAGFTVQGRLQKEVRWKIVQD